MLTRTLVKSLKRLYTEKRVTLGQIAERVENKTISAAEYEYIVGEAYKT